MCQKGCLRSSLTSEPMDHFLRTPSLPIQTGHTLSRVHPGTWGLSEASCPGAPTYWFSGETANLWGVGNYSPTFPTADENFLAFSLKNRFLGPFLDWLSEKLSGQPGPICSWERMEHTVSMLRWPFHSTWPVPSLSGSYGSLLSACVVRPPAFLSEP